MIESKSLLATMKQLVEALEWCHGGEPIGTAEAIKVGKKAIAQLEKKKSVAEDDYCFGDERYYAND
jgi:hypothetical protein